MNVAVVFPLNAATPIEIVRQEVEGAKAHFPSSDFNVSFFSSDAHLASWQAQFPDLTINREPIEFEKDGQVVFLQSYDLKEGGSADGTSADRAAKAGATTSTIDYSGRLRPHKRAHTAAELHNTKLHVFNELSSPENFYYFPYGYQFRYAGMGPMNAFGCRITTPLESLKTRKKNHKIVACFGGSAGWSMLCLHHQMYTEVMQQRLNTYCRDNNIDLSFTVLNFGQHGHVVMNEMLSYTNYCWDLRPDVVVAHDGYNDAVYGLMCDPRLLEDWDMVYQENLEGWSQILHQTSDRARTQNELPYRALNLPVRVLKSYVKRKRQFASIVQCNGSFFVWGLQPAACSRKKRSPLEASLLARHLNIDYAPVVANVEGMYRILSQNLRLGSDTPFVNCDAAFAVMGRNHLLLGDDVHLMPEGDAVVARLYSDAIIANYIDNGRWLGKSQ